MAVSGTTMAIGFSTFFANVVFTVMPSFSEDKPL
jgi:hypothetical protein